MIYHTPHFQIVWSNNIARKGPLTNFQIVLKYFHSSSLTSKLTFASIQIKLSKEELKLLIDFWMILKYFHYNSLTSKITFASTQIELSKEELKLLIDEGQRSLGDLNLNDDDEEGDEAVAEETGDGEWEDVEGTEGAEGGGGVGGDAADKFYKMDDYDEEPDSKHFINTASLLPGCINGYPVGC